MRVRRLLPLLLIALWMSLASSCGSGGSSKSDVTTAVTTAACTGSSPNLTAASPALADIQACVALATGSDTINVPAGSVNWGGGTLSLTKGVQIIGAGIGNTVITSGHVNYTPSSGNWAANYMFRLSGFSWLAAGGGQIHTFDAGCAVPAQTNFRVDHNRFSNTTAEPGAMYLYGFRGVIDHNSFDLIGYATRIGWGDQGACSGQGGYGAGHWQIDQFGPFLFGDIDTTIYFEDNTLTDIDRIVTDGDEGGSFVVRYNTIDGGTNGQLLDLHAHAGASGDWPTRGGEIYGNAWTGGGAYWLKNQGAGRTLLFMNRGGGLGGSWYVSDNECIIDGTDPHFMQTNNSYFWSNRTTNTDVLQSITILTQVCNGRQVNQLDLSLWKDNQAWTPGFPLTSGVAQGILANLPTTCTPGTAYWATSQSTTSLAGMVGVNPITPIAGTLYQCSHVAYGPNGYDPEENGTANTWVALFTPAPYPHPLQK